MAAEETEEECLPEEEEQQPQHQLEVEDEDEDEDYVCELCGSSVVPNGAEMLKCSTDGCWRGRHAHCMTPQMSLQIATKATLVFSCAVCTRDRRLRLADFGNPPRSTRAEVQASSGSSDEADSLSESSSDQEYEAPPQGQGRVKQKPNRGRGRGGVGGRGSGRETGARPSSPSTATAGSATRERAVKEASKPSSPKRAVGSTLLDRNQLATKGVGGSPPAKSKAPSLSGQALAAKPKAAGQVMSTGTALLKSSQVGWVLACGQEHGVTFPAKKRVV